MGIEFTKDRHGIHATYERGTTGVDSIYFPGYAISTATAYIYPADSTTAALTLTSTPGAGLTIVETDGGDTVEMEITVAQGNALTLGDGDAGTFALFVTLVGGDVDRVKGRFVISEKESVP